MTKLLPLLAMMMFAGASAVKADDFGLASIHDWRNEAGRRVCMSDHFHDGTGSGQTRQQAEAAAKSSWTSFTVFEYGTRLGKLRARRAARRWIAATRGAWLVLLDQRAALPKHGGAKVVRAHRRSRSQAADGRLRCASCQPLEAGLQVCFQVGRIVQTDMQPQGGTLRVPGRHGAVSGRGRRARSSSHIRPRNSPCRTAPGRPAWPRPRSARRASARPRTDPEEPVKSRRQMAWPGWLGRAGMQHPGDFRPPLQPMGDLQRRRLVPSEPDAHGP